MSGRPKSKALYERALKLFPSGVTHDTRHLVPFPIYVNEAKGSRKWDVDGNEYIDYAMGHGALLLGHGREEIVKAVRETLVKGTHYGASSELEVKWAELVKKLVPCAERVKFTNSGTEATLLALRLARLYTKRDKIIKFQGHFHGWQDYMAVGEKPPWDLPPPGVPEGVVNTVVVLPCDLAKVEAALSGRDIAAVILEPTGGSWAKMPLPEDFLKELRGLTKKHDTLLIFDEVVTGFRWSPGGAQGFYGVEPDITTLAKILAGGLPGGAVVGREEILKLLEFKKDKGRNRRNKIAHHGTFNANPLSAAAGIACLEIVKSGEPQGEASERTSRLRKSLNGVINRLEVKGCVYGESSVFHILLGASPPGGIKEDIRNPGLSVEVLKMGVDPQINRLFQLSMLIEGVDIFHMGGLLSSVHTDEDIEKTKEAFRRTIGRLRGEGIQI